MRNAMTQSNANPAKLVEDFLPLIKHQVQTNKVLDLACGSGRNGLFLNKHHIPVIFADNNPSALQNIAASELFDRENAETWLVDFEQEDSKPLKCKKFDVVMVFNYLHRPLMEDIKECLVDGGLLLYETFTTEQALIGRPKNPDYLLTQSELRRWFDGWELLHYFEGEETKPHRFFANLVVRKPYTD